MRYRRSILGAILGLCLFGAASAEGSEPPPPRPPASALGLIRDMRLTVLARRALARDRELSALKLGVEVRDGVATVWGEVPTADVKRQALAHLWAIDGIHGVRSELTAGFSQRDAVVDLSIPSRVPARIEIESAKPDSETGSLKKPRDRAIMVGGDVPKAVKPGEIPARGVVLRPPTVVVPPKKEVPSTDEEKAPSVRDAVEKVKGSQTRFRSVPVEVREGVVIVIRSGADDADITALAQLLRRVGGVRGVVIRSE